MSEPAAPPLLSVRNVRKTYPPDTIALHDVSLDVKWGEIVALLGPSGCGKSTLLRLIAGLDEADSGELLLNGLTLADVPVHKRNFGLMFQEFALFPHKDVAANIGFGLRMAGRSRSDTEARVDELLALVSLDGYGGRAMHELSGGERQRVALARSLAPNPRLLMLDEPLGDLDRALREELLGELRGILKSLGQTAVYVTHDQQEAYAIADRLVIMDRGRVEQIGTPQEVFEAPSSAHVASFLGLGNLLPAHVDAENPMLARTPVGAFDLRRTLHPGDHTLLIRPDSASLMPPKTTGPGVISGSVVLRSFRGSRYRLAIVVPGDQSDHRLEFELPARAMTGAEAATIAGAQAATIAGAGAGLEVTTATPSAGAEASTRLPSDSGSPPDVGGWATLRVAPDGLQLIGHPPTT